MRTDRQTTRLGGFTILELLVVLAIIAVLATMTLPALKGIGQTNLMASSSRQMVDAVALARQRAINQRTTVYLMFAGPVDVSQPVGKDLQEPLLIRQFNSYAMFAERTAGDQPGQHHPRYLADWAQLPGGALFAEWKFTNPPGPVVATAEDPEVLTFDYRAFPYPEVKDLNSVVFPYIAFGSDGGIVSSVGPSGQVVIPLARGGYFLNKDSGDGTLLWEAARPREQPQGNSVDNRSYIVIDALTGRARVDRPEIE